MIVSMTGFGDATTERDGTHYSVEIRSLNNRFYKPVIKLPDHLQGLEPEIETTLREKLVRGSITYILKTRSDSAEEAYHINVKALQLPGVCQEPRDESDELRRHGDVVRTLTGQAIAKLSAMRMREGKSLCDDLMRHTKVISENLASIQQLAPAVVQEYHKRLTQRVNLLLSKTELKVNESDLIKEVAVFAERADISEEIQRLTHHLESFEQSCRDTEHAGRKLDFITQEMLREANTIASKANDAQVARHIVEIKGSIDRLKEQVQNVE
jgi:uncharacterized protein (TIGR00255 family)